jgi:hypothetical protein
MWFLLESQLHALLLSLKTKPMTFFHSLALCLGRTPISVSSLSWHPRADKPSYVWIVGEGIVHLKHIWHFPYLFCYLNKGSAFSFKLAEGNIHDRNAGPFSFQLQEERHEEKVVHISHSEVTNPSSLCRCYVNIVSLNIARKKSMWTNWWKIVTKPLTMIIRYHSIRGISKTNVKTVAIVPSYLLPSLWKMY